MASARADALTVERLSFFVDGVPVSAPRQSRRDAFEPSPHVQRYNAWKDAVRLAARKMSRRSGANLNTRRQLWTGPVGLSCEFWLPIPRSWPAWKRQLAESTRLEHCTTPDYDNLVKAIKDALNGELWGDDGQVCRYFEPLFKTYSTHPCAIVTVHYLNGSPSNLTRNPGA